MPIASLVEATTGGWPAVRAEADLSVVYKHSPICGVSSSARGEVATFADANPDVPVWQVDVVRQRELSRRVAAELGTPHASPQVILLCRGRAVWTASHFAITRRALEGAVAAAVSLCSTLEPARQTA